MALGLARMIRRLFVTFIGLCILAVSAVVITCSTDTPPTVLTSSEPEQTFVRVTVTPVPIVTPTPAATAITQSQLTTDQLADPVFPDWLDPELNDERPEDELVIEGWREYLSNTVMTGIDVYGSVGDFTVCDEGIILVSDGEVSKSNLWGITRTAAMSPSQWGTVALIAETPGEQNNSGSTGSTYTFATLHRKDGMIMQSTVSSMHEITITRSMSCLELSAE
ncbi:MAG TPA: hypothetical protein EYQ61_03110 [Dehalococcoidia bacterium]|jgi:hypothetical protein|nr:hypothetical protein [Dehalococcoidia bacterium]HIK90070.1 hypothetical protein [Dehalococcoidia bacterium]